MEISCPNIECSEPACVKPYSMGCDNHCVLICASCAVSFHARCEVHDIGCIKNVKAMVDTLEVVLQQMYINGRLYSLENRITDFDSRLEKAIEEVEKFRTEIKEIDESGELRKIYSLQKKILTFKSKFHPSKEFIDYCAFMVHRLEVFRRRDKDESNDANVKMEKLEEDKCDEYYESDDNSENKISEALTKEIMIVKGQVKLDHIINESEFHIYKNEMEVRMETDIKIVEDKYNSKVSQMQKEIDRLNEDAKANFTIMEVCDSQDLRLLLLKTIYSKHK